MTTPSDQLLNDLIDLTLKNMEEVEKFKPLSIETLNWRATPDSWSILECLEHLCLYGDFYIPEISNRIANTKQGENPVFKSGLLGNYFAKMMLPREKLNKMKTFKAMNPIGSNLNKSTLTRFITQQEQLIALLEQARKVDLNKTKTAISISKLIKLKLGDTFRVVIYHNKRHVIQANKIVREQVISH